MDKIIDKLYYWYTVEKFSTFNVEFNKKSYFNKLPWLSERKDKHYEIYLGLYNNCCLVDFITDKYGDKDILPERVSGISCLCIFKVDENGEYIENSLKMPTLPYAINELLSGNLNSSNSSSNFDDFGKCIEGLAISTLKKVDYYIIDVFLCKLLNYFQWFDKKWFSPLGKFKVEEKVIKLENEDEPDTYLNSFYLSDIENIIRQVKNDNYGKAFKLFISQDRKLDRVDIENNKEFIEKVLQPKNIPMSKWPSKYGLSLMQQVSVNLSLKELNEEGVFSVNGPPGTGKTTLLRDIIANIVVDRAKKLSQYNNPEEAFKKSNSVVKVTMKNGKQFPYNPYILDKELKGYGVTIVSNNNNAVENISRELPGVEAIKGFNDCLEADYFKNIADNVLGMETWGLISATLGKKANCTNFSNKFWGSGFSDFANDLNDKNKVPNWQDVRRKFLDLYKDIEFYKEELDNFKKH
ncbi:hypothetical protein HMPREF1982_00370 [Clostridiales bacterium oral taxon 876 str. F0540]|nr:hypothetical protein HMPREF1982_00370 [Clostridiales bacterium oral taxon 876 str. F0540]